MNISNSPILKIALMFFLAQILGLASGILLIENASKDSGFQSLSISPFEDSSSPLNAVLLLVYVLFGAAVALFIIKYFRTKLPFRLMELGIVGGTVSSLAFSFIYAFSSLGFFASMALAIFLGGLFAVAKFLYPILKNPAAILSSAGVAAIFGFSMGFWPAILFIVGLSIYDYLAVFKTRHMLTLAQGLGTNELSFTVSASSSPSADSAGSANVHPQEASRLDLGSGDLAVPAMLAVSAYSAFGVIGSLAVVFGSIISIFITLKFVVEKHVVLPALPPICLGALIMLLFSQIILMAV